MKTSVLLAVLLLTGCASVSTIMKHPNGQVFTCAASGFGILGVPTALMSRQTCVDDAKKLGFVEVL